MVDSVLYFEGDPSRELRILRSFKNRFGYTSEIGLFEMKEQGLVSAKEASSLFFQRRAYGGRDHHHFRRLKGVDFRNPGVGERVQFRSTQTISERV